MTGVTRNLEEHFTTRIASRYRDMEGDPPSRLVYLLDHEYTARGLSWSRLKGADASRAALLRAAADNAGCDVVLALADIQETWDAYESGSEYGNWRWQEDDADEDGSGGVRAARSHRILDQAHPLDGPGGSLGGGHLAGRRRRRSVCHHVDPSTCGLTSRSTRGTWATTATRWTAGTGGGRSWCGHATGPSPTGPRRRRPGRWMSSSRGCAPRTRGISRAAVATLAPFWDSSVRAQNQTRFLAKALRVAAALDDQETAGVLLRPFSVESLRRGHMAPLAKLAGRYGEQWVGELLRTWFGERPIFGYAGGQDRAQWLTSLPGLCEALHAQGNPGTVVAHRILELAWDSIATRSSSASRRNSPRTARGSSASWASPSPPCSRPPRRRRRSICGTRWSTSAGSSDDVTACVLPALRTAATFPADLRRDGGFVDLASDCAARLRARLTRPARDDDDWSIGLPDGCTCDLCGTLGSFLQDRVRRSFEWPLAEQRRRHIHSRIDMGELPVRHQTRRTGRPFTLVLTKTPQLFERERQARVQQQADLDWLTAEWHQPY